jgi:hypothetical protein
VHQNQSASSGASRLPTSLRKRLARLRTKLGTAKATAAALQCSASTYARAAAGLALRPGSVALVRAGLERIDGSAMGAEEQSK